MRDALDYGKIFASRTPFSAHKQYFTTRKDFKVDENKG
jgi:hypothetical protein